MKDGFRREILMVMNLSDQFWKDFQVGIPFLYEMKELIHTDWEMYGGNTKPEDETWRVEDEPHREGRILCMWICRPSVRESSK